MHILNLTAKVARFLAVCFALTMLDGCSWMMLDPGVSRSREGTSSSLVDYLYPEGEKPSMVEASHPQLDLPLRVGLAFVPAERPGDPALGAATKSELLATVRDHFLDLEYIESIDIVPDTYLRQASGFDGLGQVARLYGVDVMALVSYDQVATVGERKSAFLYWTIVGAYLVEASENDVSTFVDTAVFDMQSRRLLLRAPGTDRRQEASTLVDVPEVMRETREEGFRAAVADMTQNLAVELERFEERLKDEPELAQVTWKEGEGGGMGHSALWLVLLAIVGLRRLIRV